MARHTPKAIRPDTRQLLQALHTPTMCKTLRLRSDKERLNPSLLESLSVAQPCLYQGKMNCLFGRTIDRQVLDRHLWRLMASRAYGLRKVLWWDFEDSSGHYVQGRR